MYPKHRTPRRASFCAVAIALLLGACSQSVDALDNIQTSSVASSTRGYSMKERECLARAMFFESRRSSRDGLVAVGTVVMNRVGSDQYPDTICGVVGQKRQFAPGVLSRPMNSKALPDVMAAADAVLAGERHAAVRNAHHFHQAGLKFPYKNMHYVLEAGGNAFYEKRSRRTRQIADESKPTQQVAAVSEPAPQSTATGELSFTPDSTAADRIGALIAGQDRPASSD